MNWYHNDNKIAIYASISVTSRFYTQIATPVFYIFKMNGILAYLIGVLVAYSTLTSEKNSLVLTS